jgi:hypothetical protein
MIITFIPWSHFSSVPRINGIWNIYLLSCSQTIYFFHHDFQDCDCILFGRVLPTSRKKLSLCSEQKRNPAIEVEVSRPVRLGVRPPSGARDQFFFHLEIFFRQLRVCYFVAPSLKRGRVCNLLYNCFYAFPEQSLLRRCLAGLKTIFYCPNSWDFPNLEGQVPVFISPRNRVTQLYPRALCSLSVASYDSQGCGEVILTSDELSLSYCRRSVDQFFLVSASLWGTWPNFILFLSLVTITLLFFLWAPSLTRGRICKLYGQLEMAGSKRCCERTNSK